jgi:hypothetical protein
MRYFIPNITRLDFPSATLSHLEPLNSRSAPLAWGLAHPLSLLILERGKVSSKSKEERMHIERSNQMNEHKIKCGAKGMMSVTWNILKWFSFQVAPTSFGDRIQNWRETFLRSS